MGEEKLLLASGAGQGTHSGVGAGGTNGRDRDIAPCHLLQPAGAFRNPSPGKTGCSVLQQKRIFRMNQ